MSNTAPQPLPALWLAWNSTHTAIRFWTADPAVAAQQASTGLILTPFYSAGQQRKAWNEGYKHGAWQGQHCAPQPATDIDEAQLQRLHERGAVAWAGVDAADLRAGGDGLPLGNRAALLLSVRSARRPDFLGRIPGDVGADNPDGRQHVGAAVDLAQERENKRPGAADNGQQETPTAYG